MALILKKQFFQHQLSRYLRLFLDLGKLQEHGFYFG